MAANDAVVYIIRLCMMTCGSVPPSALTGLQLNIRSAPEATTTVHMQVWVGGYVEEILQGFYDGAMLKTGAQPLRSSSEDLDTLGKVAARATRLAELTRKLSTHVIPPPVDVFQLTPLHCACHAWGVPLMSRQSCTTSCHGRCPSFGTQPPMLLHAMQGNMGDSTCQPGCLAGTYTRSRHCCGFSGARGRCHGSGSVLKRPCLILPRGQMNCCSCRQHI